MIDLHVHSYISDGSNSPSEIIQMAHSQEIYAIALTDHDSIDGIEEARREAEKYQMNFIEGIELSVAYGKDRLIHILGLGINSQNPYFLKTYHKFRKVREQALEKVIWTLKKQQIELSFEKLKEYAVGPYRDRQTVAKYLIEKKLANSAPEVWQKYLDPIPYERREILTAEEALHMIKEAGGLSFLAHYHKPIGLEGYSALEAEKHIESLKSLGLDGIERYYPSFTSEHIAYAEYLMHKYGLIPCGGTDYHGTNRPEIALGIGCNDFQVPDCVYDSMSFKMSK